MRRLFIVVIILGFIISLSSQVQSSDQLVIPDIKGMTEFSLVKKWISNYEQKDGFMWFCKIKLRISGGGTIFGWLEFPGSFKDTAQSAINEAFGKYKKFRHELKE